MLPGTFLLSKINQLNRYSGGRSNRTHPYLYDMCLENDIQQRWLKLETTFQEKFGVLPLVDDILLYIGVRESGLPSKEFTPYEKINLVQMAVCTVLAPARYYELMWVEDTGFPHFKQLAREPEMSALEREDFLKPHILLYAEKNKLV